MKIVVFISAVSGVGKSSTCKFIKDSNMLNDYEVYDIDDLENINDYNEKTYGLFYENAIKKAIQKSGDKNIIIGSCINPGDIKRINQLETNEVIMILLTCSNEELTKRLKSRDKQRNNSSDEFINSQIEYQNYLIKHESEYQFHIDNTNKDVETIGEEIIYFIKS